MRVLVTGGAGFIGSHLCGKLLSMGHRVVCLDNLSTGSKDNVRRLEDHCDFEFVEHDVVKPFAVTVDRVYHLACPASPVAYQSAPIETLITAVMGTKHALDVALTAGARALLASTSEVYGDPEVVPQPESYHGRVNTTGPRACYDEGKRAAETLCSDYFRQYEMDVRIARIFNTYGPHMAVNDGRVVSEFIVRALQCRSLPIHGDGRQTRSFCYVDDLVDGLIALMEYEGDNAAEPVNLGRPEEIEIFALAKMIHKLTHATEFYNFTARPQDDPCRRCPDISRAVARLGWAPVTSPWVGLEKTIAWFKDRIRKEAVA